MARTLEVMIATPLEERLAQRIRDSDPRVRLWYDRGLLPTQAYPGDHRGNTGFRRDDAGERAWSEMLARAEVLFGIPGDSPEGLRDAIDRGPRVRWVAATAAGAGEQVRAARLPRRVLERVAVTTSSGVHAVPLAEFAMLGLLALAKDLRSLERARAARRWPARRRPVGELRGRTLLVLGLGAIGQEVARLAAAFGMRVLGVRRTPRPVEHVDEVHATADLHELLPRAEALVVTLPLTKETEGLLDAAALDALPRGALLVNVGRGGVIDEEALVERLRSRRIAGAALDVFAVEPLPPSSPLWELPNVLVSPHTAALSAHENERIVDLFIDNLRRYLAAEPLRNRVHPKALY
ncbi:MAG TPA: D-2-hydroxyacid dehydrogenase [Actinomycetes bacterium]|nr:D-2-hydroxyacid dehydrogenase [Actinomycetes bacterium]